SEPRMFLPLLEEDPHVLVNHSSRRPRPTLTHLGWTASCVGGGTTHMGATLHRLHPDDFRCRERFGPIEDLADWPYGYAELEPYYSQAEWLVGVSGDERSMPEEMF